MQNFNTLTVKEQIEFINVQLKKDKTISVNKLCKALGINRSTMLTRIAKEGYKFDINTRQYIKEGDTKMVQDNTKLNKINDIDKEIRELLEYKEQLIRLAKESVNIDNKSDNIIDNSLVNLKTTNHNFKVYTSIKNEIQDLQKQYPQYRLQDLVSTALHEYYLKHSKKK